MAEEKRSISISYKADLKDLINKLKRMPNVTEAEAKKMVAALDRQLKQAEKAAKKSADASSKAAKEAAKAAKRGAADFEDMADAARRAENKLERVGEASGDIDRGFSSIGLALRGVNPQLADAADGLADAFAVTEGLTMSFSALNPLVLAAGVVVGALTLAYTAHEAELEKVKQTTLEYRDAQKALIESQEDQQRNLEDAASKVREQRLEYQLLTGEINEYQYNLEKAGESAYESFRGNIEGAQDSVKETSLLLATVQSLIEANKQGAGANVVLSEQETERLRTLQLQNNSVKNTLDLTQQGIAQRTALLILEDELQTRKIEEEKKVLAIQKMQEESKNLAMEMVTLEKELADANEEAAEQAERKAKASEKNLQAEEKAISALEEAYALSDDILKAKALQDKMDRAMAEAFLDDEGKKKLAQQDRINAEIEAITKLGIATGREAEAAMAIEALRHQGKMQNLEKEEETILGITEEQLENARMVNDSFSALTSSLEQLMAQKMEIKTIDVEAGKKQQEILDTLTEKEREALKRRAHAAIALFQLSKAASLAEVAMTTAENVAKAQGYGPILAPIMTGLAIATGTAQAAVIASQPAPQAQFHMGGMAPDEMGARVLRGEAVLDRATVRRIGGEQGVRNLQQGGSPSVQTVVIQPFKHFGRFAADLGIRKTKQVGIRGY